ncbi:hypothetical protein PR048_032984 [Dryococelus australis]|uniref:Uncharacterized protein n=1 Tax=Dryococelus australis TaxID=614101 RepID=A0ABQ9G7X2_9NEOP|nr:hypothetical protein PR048_032984 [Dryococelus australis]
MKQRRNWRAGETGNPRENLPTRGIVKLLASRLGEQVWAAPEFSHVGIVPDDATGRRVFSGILHFHRPCIPVLLHIHLASPTSALKTSMGGETGDPREDSLTNGIVRHDFQLQKSGGPAALVGGERANSSATAPTANGDIGSQQKSPSKIPAAARKSTTPVSPSKSPVKSNSSSSKSSSKTPLAAEIPPQPDKKSEYIPLAQNMCLEAHNTGDGNAARLARRSDEALGVSYSVARIALSLLDLGRPGT